MSRRRNVALVRRSTFKEMAGVVVVEREPRPEQSLNLAGADGGTPLHRPTRQIQPITEADEAEQQSRHGQSSLQQFTLAVGEKSEQPDGEPGNRNCHARHVRQMTRPRASQLEVQ